MVAVPAPFFPAFVIDRPDTNYYTPVAFDPAAVRIAYARDVRPGDLVLGYFHGRYANYYGNAYPAAPAPFDLDCLCRLCWNNLTDSVRLTTRDADGNPFGCCDTQRPSNLMLIVPTTTDPQSATPPAAEPTEPYNPAPGTEYSFSISDIARAAARLLGNDWHAESGTWGVSGHLTAPDGTEYMVGVDSDGDLFVLHDDCRIYMVTMCAAYGLDTVAEVVAATIRRDDC